MKDIMKDLTMVENYAEQVVTFVWTVDTQILGMIKLNYFHNKTHTLTHLHTHLQTLKKGSFISSMMRSFSWKEKVDSRSIWG